MLEELTEHFPSRAITAVAIVLCIIWAFNRVTCGYCKSTARMDGKTVLITGCSSGKSKRLPDKRLVIIFIKHSILRGKQVLVF